MSEIIQPVILCGGSGTRLWPLSRAGFPKQFLCLNGAYSLFQQAATRLNGITNGDFSVKSPIIVSNEEHRFLVLEQLREVSVAALSAILEPQGKNTAPALTLAAWSAIQSGEDPVLVVTPADQLIPDEEAFHKAILLAVKEAASGGIVVLGITPTSAETGYGYIKSSASAVQDGQTVQVEQFVEKPDLETAKQYLSLGGYFWNAGLFVVKASVWLRALGLFRPDIASLTQAAWDGRSVDQLFLRPDRDAFAQVPAESVDYAVLEKCPGSEIRISMVPLNAGWSDLGAWDSVWSALPKDEALNVLGGDVINCGSRETLVHATSRLVAILGVSNLVVVETPDAVLIADKARSQDVKKIVSQLTHCDRDEHMSHRKVHRPWGWYDSIDMGHRFKVKRIQVNPKASLSLQKHHHRAEHWVVVKGTAEITCGEKTILITENQSTYIPLGETHRLANPGTIPLEIIEIQSGSYLGEDDIVRLDDCYGRNSSVQ